MNFVQQKPRTSKWEAAHLRLLDNGALPEIPVLSADDVHHFAPGLQLWDSWPVETLDGRIFEREGWQYWIVMCAPRELHPDLRHDVARLRLFSRKSGKWRDCGFLLPDELNPGSREWAGSALYEEAEDRLTLFFTATGRRGDENRSFEQRLFMTSGTLGGSADTPMVCDWSEPKPIGANNGTHYLVVDQTQGKPGAIKGFRDPFFFRDPADGGEYVLFTGSEPHSSSQHDGTVGIARADDAARSSWTLLPALISAEGLNNELERPVMRLRGGRYYLFWSTQRHVFAPGAPEAPTGLYGMVADRLMGPYVPLNGSGLVAANPVEEPFQTYSWWVDSNLRVTGFVDLWGLEGKRPSDDPALVPLHFGGTVAPAFQIALDGETSHIVPND